MLKVLWIENHKPFADAVVKEFFSDSEVVVVETISESMDVLREREFSVILLDYDLNDEKGTDIFPLLHQLDCSTPVIAVSSHEKGNNELISAGARGYCSKMEFRGIRKNISDILDGSSN